MMQGIWTKYKSQHVKAIARTRNSWGVEQPEVALRLAYDHALNADENHTAAAAALARKLGWAGLWHGGGRPDDKGYMFVKIASACEGSPDIGIGREGVDWFYIEQKAAAKGN
jgi:hypothetical protein